MMAASSVKNDVRRLVASVPLPGGDRAYAAIAFGAFRRLDPAWWCDAVLMVQSELERMAGPGVDIRRMLWEVQDAS